MPITFEVKESYTLVTYTGQITDEEFLNAWESYYNDGEWKPGMHSLNDFSNADLSQITVKGIRASADYTTTVQKQHGKYVKTSVYAPNSVAYGIARVYSKLRDNPQVPTKVFQDLEEARKWILDYDTC